MINTLYVGKEMEQDRFVFDNDQQHAHTLIGGKKKGTMNVTIYMMKFNDCSFTA